MSDPAPGSFVDVRTGGLLLQQARAMALEEALGAAVPISRYTGRPELFARYLGEPLSSDRFLPRFLAIFEPSIWPVIDTLDSFWAYLDPFTTSSEFLAWLAGWLDLSLDETWTRERRRRLVASAVVLYRWRGTRRGIVEHLAAYLGAAPEVVDETGGVDVADEPPDLSVEVAPSFRVVVDGPTDEAELRRLRSIIELAKPAQAGYSIEVRTRRARS
jgi:phage tail-like protein